MGHPSLFELVWIWLPYLTCRCVCVCVCVCVNSHVWYVFVYVCVLVSLCVCVCAQLFYWTHPLDMHTNWHTHRSHNPCITLKFRSIGWRSSSKKCSCLDVSPHFINGNLTLFPCKNISDHYKTIVFKELKDIMIGEGIIIYHWIIIKLE